MATNNKHLLWFCKLLNTHFEDIIAHATYKISSGKIEGINHHIKFVIEPFSSALWIIPSALIIPVVTEKNLPTLKPLIRIGNISFELFLIHQFVIRYLSVVSNYIGFSERILANEGISK